MTLSATKAGAQEPTTTSTTPEATRSSATPPAPTPPALTPVAMRDDHSPNGLSASLNHPQPVGDGSEFGRVAPQSQNKLHAQGTDPILPARHVPNGSEPQGQRQAAALKDSARSHRRLVSATPERPQASPHGPSRFSPTSRTHEPTPTSRCEAPCKSLISLRSSSLILPRPAASVLASSPHRAMYRPARNSTSSPKWRRQPILGAGSVPS